MNKSGNLRLIIAVLLSVLVMQGWQYFLPSSVSQNKTEDKAVKNTQSIPTVNSFSTYLDNNIREAIKSIEASPKTQQVLIQNEKISGYVSCMGLAIHDISLLNFKEKIDSKECVKLLSSTNNEIYATYMGFQSGAMSETPCEDIDLPSKNTIWTASQNVLSPGNPVTFTWQNKDKMIFNLKLSIDHAYMIETVTEVFNGSNKNANLRPYHEIIRSITEQKKSGSFFNIAKQEDEMQIVGSVNSSLAEYKVKDILKKKQKT